MSWLCIPGWATSPDIFDPILPADLNIDRVDLNFFSEGEFTKVTKSHYDCVICYSLGSLLALKLMNINDVKKIIFIGGFSSFLGSDIKQAKLRKIKISLMIRGLKKAPSKVLKDFYTEAELNFNEKPTINVNNLIHGLELLRDCDMYQELCNTEAEIFTIHGKDDVIVPEELNRMQFEEKVSQRYILDGNHGIIESSSAEIQKILSEII